MELKYEVSEKTTHVEKSESWSGNINGFDISFRQDDHRAEFSIYPERHHGMRLGILHCYPRSVADIEKLTRTRISELAFSNQQPRN